MTLSLSTLPAAYDAARAEASAGKPVVEDMPPGVCRYCGKHMRLFQGSRNDGHARCLVTFSFQRAVYDLWWHSPSIGRDDIAAACGVSVATVSGWIANVERTGRAA